MKDTLTSFELSKLAKEKGFDWVTVYAYQDMISAPTLSLLQKWVREVCKVHIVVDWDGTGPDGPSRSKWAYYYGTWTNANPASEKYKSGFNTFEEALEAGLLKYLKQ